MKTNQPFHSARTRSATALLVTAVVVALSLTTFDAFAPPPGSLITPVCITFRATHSSGVATGIRGDQPDASGASTYCFVGKVDAYIGGGNPRLFFDSHISGKCPCRRLNFGLGGFGGLGGLVCGGYTFPAPGIGQNSDVHGDVRWGDVDGDGTPDDLDGDGNPNHNDIRNLEPEDGTLPIAIRFRHYETTSEKNFWTLHYGDTLGGILNPQPPKTAEITALGDTDGDGKLEWLIESKVGAIATLTRTLSWVTVATCGLDALQTPVFSMLIEEQ